MSCITGPIGGDANAEADETVGPVDEDDGEWLKVKHHHNRHCRCRRHFHHRDYDYCSLYSRGVQTSLFRRKALLRDC
jgi:hypothetical protein